MSEFAIIELFVSQGEVNWHRTLEQFPSLEEAQLYKESNYRPKGFYWTGLKEYKIVEFLNGKLQQCWGCNMTCKLYLENQLG